MAIVSVFEKLSALARFLVLRFCLFWGFSCKLPITRANDDLVFLRACARARWKAMFYQKLPIYLMMAPIWATILLTRNKAVVIILWYALPVFLVGIIGVLAGTWTATSGSFDIHTRKEYARLQLVVCTAAARADVTVSMSATDVTQRMGERLLNQPWNVRMPRKQVGRPVQA